MLNLHFRPMRQAFFGNERAAIHRALLPQHPANGHALPHRHLTRSGQSPPARGGRTERPWMLHVTATLLVLTLLAAAPACSTADDATDQRLAGEYVNSVQPLLKKFCHECHSADQVEAEIDLGRFETMTDVRRDIPAWLKVRGMLASRQMPPKDSPQPQERQRQIIERWVQQFLTRQAEATAGDPGPVILRRLNNAEYNYTVRDLTGVPSLNPTREFPVDGAAGEGFINSGAAQAMSPALVTKYLDAAKQVADHAVLTPAGIRFSQHRSRRDWTNERIAAIMRFYETFTTQSDVPIQVGGTGKVPNEGGSIPLVVYLTATLEERDALSSGKKSLDTVARERSLNRKYLGILWQTLTQPESPPSQLMEHIRQQWRAATPTTAGDLVGLIGGLQQALFQYNPIGHIGTDGKPKSWMTAANPLVADQSFRVPLPPNATGNVSIFLSAADAGDGRDSDFVVWKNPRLVQDGQPDIPLRDAVGLTQRLQKTQREMLSRTANYLAAVAELKSLSKPVTEPQLTAMSTRRKLDRFALQAWANYLGVGLTAPAIVSGHFTKKTTHGTYNFIHSWGTPATPSIGSNASDQQVRIPGIAKPHSVFAHPSPTLFVAFGWQSPITGTVQVEANLADAHPECGSGQEWFLQHRTGNQAGNLWKGRFDKSGSAKMKPTQVSVRKGDVIAFILGPDREYACDLTEMNLTITETAGDKRVWDLADDVADDLLASNPHADRHGNATTWHFYKGDLKDVRGTPDQLHSVPVGSLLARWLSTDNAEQQAALASQVQTLALGATPPPTDSPDGLLYRQLMELTLTPHSLSSLLQGVPADARFGQHPEGQAVPTTDLILQAPTLVEFQLPAKLAAGRTLVADVALDAVAGREGSIRAVAGTQRIAPTAIGSSNPIIVTAGSQARERLLREFTGFRAVFPPHVCYSRIVPVDEVVTLTLFYRQDEALQRLMLNDAEVAQLERLWDELFFVAQEPLRYEVAFEQIREFATQDRPDLVKIWDPLKAGVVARADRFRQRLVDTEPTHVRSLLAFADRAWRRRLSAAEQTQLRGFYRALRDDDLGHDEAMRLTIARVLASPAFLYRRETQPSGPAAQPVSADALASRLSYFLWSSKPDRELRQAAANRTLVREDVLREQTRRMLKDPRTRRLAVQFACQWLHLRDFDQNDDKNETRFPEFAELRGDMYEETIRFFTDMFRHDGSILDLVGAQHTFVNGNLAQHYQLQGITGTEWQRVENVQSQGRGGVLGMATFLASQSGASRTSPILRGNWIFETLLGERLPRPPANVPQLPEQVPSGLTARQLIEQHSSAPACAKCHALIDPYGFALEQYDALGRLRTAQVDTSTSLLDGRQLTGIDGLRAYLLNVRRDDFVRQFCRKLLGFALAREVQLSDEPLLDQMQRDLQANAYRFHVAVETIVSSPQFRQIRGSDFSAD